MIKFELEGSINAALNAITSGTYGFSVDTVFGKCAIEILTEDYDPMNPVTVMTWTDAPMTNFRAINRRRDYDYWIGIGCTNIKRHAIKAYVITGIVGAMFLDRIGMVPDEDILDAAVYSFMKHTGCKIRSIESMADDMLSAAIDMFHRNNRSVRAMAQKLVKLRWERCNDTLQIARLFIEDELDKGYNIDFICLMRMMADRHNLDLTFGYVPANNPALIVVINPN